MSIEININGASVTVLDDNQLAIVNNKTRKTDNWLLQTFFPNKIAFPNKDAVPLDELDTTQALAPFVSPLVQAKPIVSQGSFEREYVKAPYLKPARSLTPDTVYDASLLSTLQDAGLIRSANGRMSEAERLRVAQISEFNRLRESIDNRKVLMGADILTTGSTVCVGDDHPAYLVDYKRAGALKFSPDNGWDTEAGKPVSDIENMIDRLITEGGSSPVIALMSSKVFANLIKNPEFKERIQRPQGANTPDIFAPRFNRTDRAMYRGDFDGIQFWTYDVAHRLNGVSKRFIDETGFYLVADTSGYQAQCMIKHMDAWGLALEYFDYTAVQKDPSIIKMISESSPLIVPSNPNGVCGGTGFVTT